MGRAFREEGMLTPCTHTLTRLCAKAQPQGARGRCSHLEMRQVWGVA